MIRHNLLALLLISLTCFAAAMPVLNKQEFTDAYCDYLRQQFPQATVSSVKDMEVSITLPGFTQQWTSHLDNAYIDYTSDPKALTQVLNTYSNGFRELIENKEPGIATENILPVIRTVNFYEEATGQLNGGKPTTTFIKENFTDQLAVYFVIDTPTTIRPMTEKELKQLDIKRENLMSVAIGNLLRILPEISLLGDSAHYSMLEAGGDYESSLILDYSIWNKQNFPVMGDIVVFVLARDTVIITGTEDKQSLAQAQRMIRENNARFSHPISNTPIVLKEGRWQTFSF